MLCYIILRSGMYPKGWVRLVPTTAIPRGGWERTSFWGLWPYQKEPTDAVITGQVILGGDEALLKELSSWGNALVLISFLPYSSSSFSSLLSSHREVSSFTLSSLPRCSALSQATQAEPVRHKLETSTAVSQNPETNKKNPPPNQEEKEVSPKLLGQWWGTDTPPIAI